MKFKYSAFTDNTPEMREWLLKLGYVEDYWLCAGERPETPYLVSTFQGHFAELDEPMLTTLIKLMMDHHDMVHSCCDKPELFKAISSVREDSNIGQYFIIDTEIYVNVPKGTWFVATNIDGGRHVGCQIDPMYCHKATIPELIEYFKTKESCEN